jgi:hypothetical protein
MQNCTSCHGIPGKNNFTKLDPLPGDPATDKFQSQTDGALYHKITTGRGAMPSFKDVITENERWSVISYIRSFNTAYIQLAPVKLPEGKFAGMELKVNIEFDSLNGLLNAAVIGIKDNDTIPVAGLELSLYAKRYFGKLLIDQPRVTDKSGKAVYEYKKLLPGDKAGKILISAGFNAEGLQEYQYQDTLQAGTILKAGSLIDTRAMWTVARHTPIWLLLSYLLVVTAVWSFLIYIVLQIVKIRKIGKQAK